jgi:TPP-dependent pyruvate/acetoin dehydrogenase alpha subunit
MINKQQLIDFEQQVADIYATGKIRGPIHLSDGNEENLIEIFSDVKQNDWVFSTWRSHYHALLKGVPQDDVLKEILAGKSITLQFPDYNFYSSAIVAGNTPIALGVAEGLRNSENRVYCFIGDMAAHSGIFNECYRYSVGHNLPITWVVEDNQKSVGTPTENTTGIATPDLIESLRLLKYEYEATYVDLVYYKYNLTQAHSGVGKFIEF